MPVLVLVLVPARGLVPGPELVQEQEQVRGLVRGLVQEQEQVRA